MLKNIDIKLMPYVSILCTDIDFILFSAIILLIYALRQAENWMFWFVYQWLRLQN